MSQGHLRVCPGCGQKNRIPADHLADRGRCGACRAELEPAGRPVEVDAADFSAIVASAKVPVLVDFWAPWCGPCRMAAPELEKLAGEVVGRALVLKVNTDENPELASRFGVRAIPTFVVMKDGREVQKQAGLVRRDVMRRWLDAAQ